MWMMIFTGKMAGITIHGTDAGWFLTECAVRTILLIWENRGVRYLTGALGSVIVIGVLWLVVVFFGMDFVRPQLSIDGNQVTVRSAEYGISFDKKEIEDAELLEDLPEEDFVRINGLSDSRQLLGKFKGEESGKAMFYIRRGETPVLKIKLPEYTVFVNSEESGKVQEWYEELSS